VATSESFKKRKKKKKTCIELKHQISSRVALLIQLGVVREPLIFLDFYTDNFDWDIMPLAGLVSKYCAVVKMYPYNAH